MKRKIILFKDYYLNFLEKLSKKEVDKIERRLVLIKTAEKMPYHYVKYIRDEIYELRISCDYSAFRIFFIYDGNTIVVLFNGFRKKTQKTPKKEIEKAIKLKLEYYKYKNCN